MRNSTITIVKGLAIILVVMAHSSCPTYLARFAYMICVAPFFIASGYCFDTKYLDDPYTFIRRRFSSLYLPFVKWAIFFLILNHLWFRIGFLSEQYGNALGGVTHPLSLHGGMQALWSIVFNMSGYDAFLAGAFWFFRTMLISSITFLLAFKFIAKIRTKLSYTNVAIIVGTSALLLAIWKTVSGLTITGLAQGGYRELMAIFLIAAGYAYRQFELWLAAPSSSPVCFDPKKCNSKSAKRSARCGNTIVKGAYNTIRFLGRTPAASIAISAIAIAIIVAFAAPSMTTSAKNIGAILLLALGAILGFSLIKNVAYYINKIGNPDETTSAEATHTFRRAILFLGENTLYVFAFHLLAFKLVSMLKVGVYALPWEMVGGHPVVRGEQGQWFWVLYTLTGIVAPLLGVIVIRKVAQVYTSEDLKRDASAALRYLWAITQSIGRLFGRYALIIIRLIGKALIIVGRYIWRALHWLFIGVWKSIYGFCQTFVDTVKEASDIKQDE